MLYIHYLAQSLQVFIACFILGTFIDTQFHNLQNQYPNINPLYLAIAQLITIISTTYFLHQIKFFHNFFEEYSPNVLFSSFLLALQSNMIDNFKKVLHYKY
jgi:amino acid permease